MNRRFSERFGSQWIKVKFYKQKPDLLPHADLPLAQRKVQRLENVRFCQATNEAVTRPVILDRQSISCLAARYCFGWEPGKIKELLRRCQIKRAAQIGIVEAMLSKMPYFKQPFNYIGLNTEGEPDLLLSYLPAQEAMQLMRIYHNQEVTIRNDPLFGMMSICGGIAVRTYLEGNITFSFGCEDSRKYANIRRENLAVGIPKRLFKLFVQ